MAKAKREWQPPKRPPKYPSEAWVKMQIKDILNSLGIWWFMPNGNHFGERGIPDFVCSYDMQFVGIEAKKADGQWSKLQQDKAKEITEKGAGTYFVVDEFGLEKLHEALFFRWDSGYIYDFRGKTLNKLEEANGSGECSSTN